MSREQAKAIIEKLVERFAEHRKEYHLADYNEQKARQDFINPFFKALGWDIDNEKGDSEAYREVIYEDKVVVKGKTKAPDYGFRLTGSGEKRLFYVEAKKPSVQIKINKESAYQLRRYGSSAQAHVSILTNFEDFIVYDCSKVPNLNDSATVARLKHIGFEDYVKEFDFLYDTFSHEAVTKGRFDKYVQASANKKGTDTLDKRFVESLDQWRKYLATSIALNNKKINDEELNFAVQQTIDRLIFLRFCEDRSVEPYGQLQTAASKGDAYKNLLNLFQQADDKYNSGLFDFEKDTITKTLKVDNKVIKTVVEELYYPLCNFEFSVMPVEILGNAYEQFLGKVIRITPARGVKIEEKPEVRKAGGVYYTPQYIVDYIVKNTVGKLIDGKAPKDIETLKIVDPACGSGSFLVGAYQFLLSYHLDFYYKEQKRLTAIIDNKNTALKEKKESIKLRAELPITPDGKLTTKIKKQILVNNIYGVDLDANATEVSKLSLLLKCMEGETAASVKTITLNLNDRVLPNLDDNIKDGNSLIDTDIYDTEIDFGEEKKIKPFSWKKQFPTVFKQGGFDIVIGNPPYVDYRLLSDIELKYFKHSYHSAKTKEKYSLYIPFIELGKKLISKKGLFGYIIPNTFLVTDMGYYLREFLLKNIQITEITDVSKLKVFGNVGTYPVLLFLEDNKTSKYEINISYPKDTTEFNKLTFNKIDVELIRKDKNLSISTSFNTQSLSVIKKLETNSKSLSELVTVFVWGTSITGFKSYKISKEKFSLLKNKKDYNKVIQTSDIKSYHIDWQEEYINTSIYSPKVIEYFQVKEKIVIARLTKRIQATIDSDSYFLGKSSMIIKPKIDSKLLIGLLNSNVLNYYYKAQFDNTHMAGGYMRFDIPYLSRLPIVNGGNKNVQTEIIKHVDLLLKLNEELKEIKLQSKIDQVKQRIEHSEEKINQLVYDLYELTPEEIAIIEGGEDE
ncbi:MAG TPA: TaqI-like C-terminal specificity domain-containing protein [Bacteroidia bacterium]|nr:TaqI-like C-terminal specificity domain-containing protein [Bacteroidia bacterium]